MFGSNFHLFVEHAPEMIVFLDVFQSQRWVANQASCISYSVLYQTINPFQKFKETVWWLSQESYRNHVLFTRVSEKRGGYIRLKEAVNHVLQGDREKSMSLSRVNVLFGCSDLQLTFWQISWPIRPFISNIQDKCPANCLD